VGIVKNPFKIDECMRNENDREYMKLGIYTQGAEIRRSRLISAQAGYYCFTKT